MAEEQAGPTGPDLTLGVALAQLPDGGKVLGRVGEEQVLLARSGAEVFAVGAHCSNYHGPLADGLVVDGTVRCPWHHACFDLVPRLRMADIVDRNVVVLAPEERDGVDATDAPSPSPRSSA